MKKGMRQKAISWLMIVGALLNTVAAAGSEAGADFSDPADPPHLGDHIEGGPAGLFVNVKDTAQRFHHSLSTVICSRRTGRICSNAVSASAAAISAPAAL